LPLRRPLTGHGYVVDLLSSRPGVPVLRLSVKIGDVPCLTAVGLCLWSRVETEEVAGCRGASMYTGICLVSRQAGDDKWPYVRCGSADSKSHASSVYAADGWFMRPKPNHHGVVTIFVLIAKISRVQTL